MQQKVVTSEIFQGRKAGYAESLNQAFASSRLGKKPWEGENSGLHCGLSREEHGPSRKQVFLTGLVMTPAVPVPSLGEGDINPKVLRLLGTEKIQV